VSRSLAIELGTTFVAAAVARDRRAEMVPLGDASALADASVHVGENGSLTNGDVAESAGLTPYSMVTEPEAAAGHHGATRHFESGEGFAVHDLGGRHLRRDRPAPDSGRDGGHGAPDDVECLGGPDFDDAVPAHVDAAAGGFLHQLDMSDARTVVALAWLRQDCTAAKEAVAVDMGTTVPVFLPSRHMEVRLSRQEFQDLIRVPVEYTPRALGRTLRTAGVAPGELSSVPLVGGSSRIPGDPASVGSV
jgi:molecular chaperone DnaK (HSP70)